MLLVIIAVLERRNHIYFEVGKNYSETSDEFKAAETTFLGISYTMIGLCFFEFIMMIAGTSVPPIFAKYNLL